MLDSDSESEPPFATSDTSRKAQSLMMMNAISPGVFGFFLQGPDIVLVSRSPPYGPLFRNIQRVSWSSCYGVRNNS